MDFTLIPTKVFLKQVLSLSERDKAKIKAKLLLAEQNPYRYKSVHSREFPKVFRIRITIDNKEKRLAYAVVKNKILIAGILDRDKDYRELEEYLKKAKKEL